MNSYFDEIATEWEKLRESFFSDRVREKAILAASVGAGGVAADIGAGTRFITHGVVRRGVQVIAGGESERMLAEPEVRVPVACAIPRRGLLLQIFERRCGGYGEHLHRVWKEAR